MASRATVKQWIRSFLGSTKDDPFFDDITLDPIVQQSVDAILADIQTAAPNYLRKTVTLQPDSATSHIYTFSSQASPVTDFAGWLAVRYNDSDGLKLRECRSEELETAGTDYFAVSGVDEAPEFETSAGSPVGTPLWMRYRFWPAELTADESAITGIPLRFHDVVALEAMFAFGLGGEQRWPQELFRRWVDRRAQLTAHCAIRGAQPQRARIEETEEYDL